MAATEMDWCVKVGFAVRKRNHLTCSNPVGIIRIIRRFSLQIPWKDNSVGDGFGIQVGGSQAIRRVAVRVAEAALRVVWLLPQPVRGRLRRIAAWSDRRRLPPPVEDWSNPLIGARSGAEQSVDMLAETTLIDAGSGLAGITRLDNLHVANNHNMPVLRCLLVTSRLDVGGLEEIVAFLARRLPTYGLHTAVLHTTPEPSLTGEPRGRLARMLQSSGIEVCEVDENAASTWIEQWHPDVISAHGAPEWVYTATRRAAVPYVDNVHGMYRLFGEDWRWHAEAVRKGGLAAIVVVSELVRLQYLESNSDISPERVILIPNGIDDERRSGGNRVATRDRLGLTDEYLFVSLARHCMQKNSYGLVAAFAELARQLPEVHLVIAGRPDDLRYYRRVVRLRDSLPCGDRIHLRDHAAAPAELLAAADGFVLDSFFEGWSLASMEALFAGVPVVVSDVGGAREQVADDPHRGYLISNPIIDPLRVDWESVRAACYRAQANRDELVAAMRQLVTDREEYLLHRERLAAESRTRFSADAFLARHVSVLRAVAVGGGLPAATPFSERLSGLAASY